MAGSAMKAVKAAVIDGLVTRYAALADFNGTTAPEWNVVPTYGYRWSQLDTERVFCGRGSVESPPAALKAGRNFRDETGTFDLIVLVSAIGASQEDADERAYAVGLVAEEWLADRKSNELGVAGLQWIRITGYEQTPLGNDNGHMCELSYHVEYRARLT